MRALKENILFIVWILIAGRAKMNKESWYARKLSNTDIITISVSDNWVVDYDRSRGMYQVSHFEDNHFKDECWFDAYEKKKMINVYQKH